MGRLGRGTVLLALSAGFQLGLSGAGEAIGDFGPETCMEGYVWREACNGDHVCVLPSVRDAARQDNAAASSRVEPGGGPYGPSTCRSGFVWREACGRSDKVCVEPGARDAATRDNAAASGRKKYPFCNEYARQAIKTAQAAITFGCSNLDGPRWTATFDQHFHWCLDSTSRSVAREQQGRGTQLVLCRQGVQ